MAELFNPATVNELYDIHEELGKGQFATVSRCSHKESHEEGAAKFVKVARSRMSRIGLTRSNVLREAQILRMCDHEKIIKVLDVFDAQSEIVLILELLHGGELFEKLCEQEYLTERESCLYLRQVLQALDHLHGMRIVHLDIKPENIVLKGGNSDEVKLVDFGLAQQLIEGEDLKEMMGTPEFVAPEIINFEQIGLYTDMWSIGVLTFILISGCSPFLGDDTHETYANITLCEYQFDDEEDISDLAKEFVASLLLKDIKKRLTVSECLNHDWMTSLMNNTTKRHSVISTAGLKVFQARQRWMASLRKINAVIRFAKLVRKNENTLPAPVENPETAIEEIPSQETEELVIRPRLPTISISENSDPGKSIHLADSVIQDVLPPAVQKRCRKENILMRNSTKEKEEEENTLATRGANLNANKQLFHTEPVSGAGLLSDEEKLSLVVVRTVTETKKKVSFAEPRKHLLGVPGDSETACERKTSVSRKYSREDPPGPRLAEEFLMRHSLPQGETIIEEVEEEDRSSLLKQKDVNSKLININGVSVPNIIDTDFPRQNGFSSTDDMHLLENDIYNDTQNDNVDVNNNHQTPSSQSVLSKITFFEVDVPTSVKRLSYNESRGYQNHATSNIKPVDSQPSEMTIDNAASQSRLISTTETKNSSSHSNTDSTNTPVPELGKSLEKPGVAERPVSISGSDLEAFNVTTFDIRDTRACKITVNKTRKQAVASQRRITVDELLDSQRRIELKENRADESENRRVSAMSDSGVCFPTTYGRLRTPTDPEIRPSSMPPQCTLTPSSIDDVSTSKDDTAFPSPECSDTALAPPKPARNQRRPLSPALTYNLKDLIESIVIDNDKSSFKSNTLATAIAEECVIGKSTSLVESLSESLVRSQPYKETTC